MLLLWRRVQERVMTLTATRAPARRTSLLPRDSSRLRLSKPIARTHHQYHMRPINLRVRANACTRHGEESREEKKDAPQLSDIPERIHPVARIVREQSRKPRVLALTAVPPRGFRPGRERAQEGGVVFAPTVPLLDPLALALGRAIVSIR